MLGYIVHLSGLFIATAYFIGCFIEFAYPLIEKAVGIIYKDNKCRPLTTMGKWTVVTGGTDGIGRGMCSELVKRGSSVCIISRNQAKLEATKKELTEGLPKDSKVKVEVFQADLDGCTEETYENIEALFNKLNKDGGLGTFIANSGISYPGAMRLNEIDTTTVNSIINLNVLSTIRLCKLAYSIMRKECRGNIICVGSGAASLPSEPLYCVYAASKAAVSSFCESLKVEAIDCNVNVQCHAPLLIPSKLSKAKASFIAPTVQSYSKSAIDCVEDAIIKTGHQLPCSSVRSPNFIHRCITLVANIVPRTLWDSFRYGETKSLRERYFKKMAKSQ